MPAPGPHPVPPPPPTRVDDAVEVLHGHRVADPYRWLEDGDATDVAAWDDAQTARTRAVLGALPARGRLHARLQELLAVPVVLGAAVAGDRLFLLERGDGRDQAVLLVAPASGAPPASSTAAVARVLVDPVALTGDDTAAIDWFQPSRDGSLVAVGTSTGGDELSTLRVVDVATGAWRDDEITRTRAASVAWRPDGSGFVYTRYPDPATVPEGESGYHRSVLEHELGADPGDDAVVWAARPDPTTWPDVRLSDDGRWLLVHASTGWDRTDVHLCDREGDRWTTVIEGVDALTEMRVVDDRLVGTTTLDAPTGRVVEAPLDHPSPDRWSDLVPAGSSVIEGVMVTAGSLLVSSTRGAVSSLHRLPRRDGGDVVPVRPSTTRRRSRSPPMARCSRWPGTATVTAPSSGSRPSRSLRRSSAGHRRGRSRGPRPRRSTRGASSSTATGTRPPTAPRSPCSPCAAPTSHPVRTCRRS